MKTNISKNATNDNMGEICLARLRHLLPRVDPGLLTKSIDKLPDIGVSLSDDVIILGLTLGDRRSK